MNAIPTIFFAFVSAFFTCLVAGKYAELTHNEPLARVSAKLLIILYLLFTAIAICAGAGAAVSFLLV